MSYNRRSNFMKFIAPPAKYLSAAIAAFLLFVSTSAFSQRPEPAATSRRPVNMLVLGDSISWGQGLKEEHKASSLVKSWLEQQTGREVHQLIEAHSGAVIGTAKNTEDQAARNAASELDGELSRAYPTIHDQIDYALKQLDPAGVDLVIVNGCINDVESRRLLNAANTPDNIRELAQAKCGPPVEALLTRIATVFPAAHVVIIGYYPVLSDKTANDLFIRALAKRFYSPEPGTPKMNDKTLRARLILISREWYQTSDQMLSAAARKVDAQLAARGSHQRVLFADPAFYPENSFAAPQSRLWGFDASWLRKMLVVLTLGKLELRTNDERRGYRSELCESMLKKPAHETADQDAKREDRLLRCKLAAVGHPNRKGAAMYADAIGRLLKPLINVDGWLKQTAPSATAGPLP
ncbi:MAG: SGNH/GDSL hydrolase family protein [Pyrinomonadaceae bacterium]